MKNKPTPSKHACMKNLIFKLKSFIAGIRSKSYIFEKSKEINDKTTANNFGFKPVLTNWETHVLETPL